MSYRNDEIKIDDALRVLEEAAREKKDILKQMVDDKYSGIKEIFSSETLSHLTEPINRVRKVISKSGRIAKRTASAAQYEMDEHPWVFMAKVAGACILLGYMLGKRADHNPNEEYDE